MRGVGDTVYWTRRIKGQSKEYEGVVQAVLEAGQNVHTAVRRLKEAGLKGYTKFGLSVACKEELSYLVQGTDLGGRLKLYWVNDAYARGEASA